MLDFAKFNGKMFFVYYKGLNDNRTLIGILLLFFCGIFFASIERIGIFCGSTTYSNAGRGMSIEESFGVFGVFFFVEVKN
jgi:hypothetical protein